MSWQENRKQCYEGHWKSLCYHWKVHSLLAMTCSYSRFLANHAFKGWTINTFQVSLKCSSNLQKNGWRVDTGKTYSFLRSCSQRTSLVRCHSPRSWWQPQGPRSFQKANSITGICTCNSWELRCKRLGFTSLSLQLLWCTKRKQINKMGQRSTISFEIWVAKQ